MDNDMTVVSSTIAKRVRNDLAKIAKQDGNRSLSNYLSIIINEHHKKVMKK